MNISSNYTSTIAVDVDLPINASNGYSFASTSSDGVTALSAPDSGNSPERVSATYAVIGGVGGTISLIGLLLNCLNMAALGSMLRKADTSTNVFLLALAVADALVLLTYLMFVAVCVLAPPLPIVSQADLPPHPDWFTDLTVHTWHIAATGASLASALITVAVAAFRAIAVTHPLRAVTWGSARRARAVCIIITLVSVAMAIPDMCALKIVTPRPEVGSLFISTQLGMDGSFRAAYSVFQEFMSSLAPFALCLVLTAILILGLARSSKERCYINEGHRHDVYVENSESDGSIQSLSNNLKETTSFHDNTRIIGTRRNADDTVGVVSGEAEKMEDIELGGGVEMAQYPKDVGAVEDIGYRMTLNPIKEPSPRDSTTVSGLPPQVGVQFCREEYEPSIRQEKVSYIDSGRMGGAVDTDVHSTCGSLRRMRPRTWTGVSVASRGTIHMAAQAERRHLEQRRITVTLSAIVGWFLVCTAPAVAWRVATWTRGLEFVQQSDFWHIWRAVADSALLLNHAGNFFLYTLSSRAYRKHCLSLFRSISTRCCYCFSSYGGHKYNNKIADSGLNVTRMTTLAPPSRNGSVSDLVYNIASRLSSIGSRTGRLGSVSISSRGRLSSCGGEPTLVRVTGGIQNGVGGLTAGTGKTSGGNSTVRGNTACIRNSREHHSPPVEGGVAGRHRLGSLGVSTETDTPRPRVRCRTRSFGTEGMNSHAKTSRILGEGRLGKSFGAGDYRPRYNSADATERKYFSHNSRRYHSPRTSRLGSASSRKGTATDAL